MDNFNEDDLEIDNIFDKPNKKKKINGKRKGNRVELELCKKLTDFFGKNFSRSVGSGSRWGQVSNMPAHAKLVFSGDLCCPEDFKWVIECKGGYDNDVDFSGMLVSGCSRIDEFIKQSSHDAEISDRKPIIMWKRSREPWVAILRNIDTNLKEFKYYIKYNDWCIVSLDTLINTTNKEYWFSK